MKRLAEFFFSDGIVKTEPTQQRSELSGVVGIREGENAGRMSITLDKGRNKRNSKSLQSGQGILPLEILMMGWMCFLAVAFITLIFFAVDLAAGSRALYLYEVDGEPKDPVLEYLVKEGKPLFEQNHPNFLHRQDTASYSPPPRVVGKFMFYFREIN